MLSVIRRALGAGVLAMLLAAVAADAIAPEGPRLAVVRMDTHPRRVELLTVDLTGAQPIRLARGAPPSRTWPFFFSPLTWSPDGGKLAFSAIVVSRKSGRLRIFTVGPDGSNRREIPETQGYGPVFSPDGRTLAFTRFRETSTKLADGKLKRRGFEGAAISVLDLATGTSRQLTPWRGGLEYIASSFSPDGSTLLATRQDDHRGDEAEPVALRLDGSAVARLFDDGGFPVYSPDGSKVVLIREVADESTDLYILDAGGAGIRRLTDTPGRLELFPSWDPSGQRLAYMRFSRGHSEAASLGIGAAVMQINADGTCQTRLLSARGAGFYVPAWQPGPGREAGRIEC